MRADELAQSFATDAASGPASTLAWLRLIRPAAIGVHLQ